MRNNLKLEEVADAVRAIEAQGLKANTKNVREHLGRGSLTTISKYMQKLNEAQKTPEAQAELDMTDVLEKLGDDFFVEFFSNEHPQTIALALTHLKPEQVAMILEKFPSHFKENIIERMEKQGPVQKFIIQKIARVIKDEVDSVLKHVEIKKGGADFVKQVKSQMQKRGAK